MGSQAAREQGRNTAKSADEDADGKKIKTTKEGRRDGTAGRTRLANTRPCVQGPERT